MDAIDPSTRLRSWHAHVERDRPAQRHLAARLRAQVAARVTVQLGRWRDALVGPHSRRMHMVAFSADLFARTVPCLGLNRQRLHLLLHPNTGAPHDDHQLHALWLGERLPVKAEVLPQAAAPHEHEAQRINSWPARPAV